MFLKFRIQLFALIFLVSNLGLAQTICHETEIRTEILFETSVEQVWKLLVDTKEYSNWHPYITSIDGVLQEGSKIKVYTIDDQKQTGKFKAFVLTVEPNKELAWGGSLGFVFSARHYFRIESVGTNAVRFVQGEYWKGWFGKWYGKNIYQKTFNSFNAMNQKMKLKLEQQALNKVN